MINLPGFAPTQSNGPAQGKGFINLPGFGPSSAPVASPQPNATPTAPLSAPAPANANSTPTGIPAGNPIDTLQNSVNSQVQSGKLQPQDGQALMEQAMGKNDLAQLPTGTGDQLGQEMESNLPSTTKTLGELQTDFPNLKADPKKAIGDYWNSIKASVQNEEQNIAQGFADRDEGRSESQQEGDTLKTVAGGAAALLSPVTSLFAAANDVPVLGTVSKVVSLPFEVMGDAGQEMAQQIVQALPIPDAAKQNIVGGLGQIFALAGQFAIGGGYESLASEMGLRPTELDTLIKNSGFKDGATLAQKYGDTDADTILKMAKEKAVEMQKNPQVTERKPTLDDLSNEKSAPAIKNEQNIQKPKGQTLDLSPKGEDFDIKGVSDYRTPLDAIQDRIQSQRPNTTDIMPPKTPVTVEGEGGFKVTKDEGRPTVRVADTQTGEETEVPRENVKAVKSTSDEIVRPKVRTVNGLREIEGTGETKIPQASKRLEASAIRQGLVESFGELPEYKTADFGQIADKVKALIDRDPDTAKEVAMGRAQPPKGVPSSFMWTILSRQAGLDGDVDLINELSKSSVPRQGVEAGRFIGGFKGLSDEDPVQAIKDLQKSREDALNRRAKAESAKLDEAIKKATSDRVSGKVRTNWSDFIKNLEC